VKPVEELADLGPEERAAHAVKLGAIGRKVTQAIVNGKVVSVLDVLVEGQQRREADVQAAAELEDAVAKGEIPAGADVKAKDAAERAELLRRGFVYMRHQNGREMFRRLKQGARVAGRAARRAQGEVYSLHGAGWDRARVQREWDAAMRLAWTEHQATLTPALAPAGRAILRKVFYGENLG